MKAPSGKLAFAYRTIASLERDRDTLAQRCRELEVNNAAGAQWLEMAARDLRASESENEAMRAEDTAGQRVSHAPGRA